MQQDQKNLQLRYFPILHALCKASLLNQQDSIKLQIQRLAEALADDNFTSESSAILGLLQLDPKAPIPMVPARLIRSRGVMPGEELTPRTQPPVDRETSTPLAELVFPEQLPTKSPFFDPTVEGAVQSLIQQWTHRDQLSEVGVQPAHSCLIYGAPGTGKTQLALWIAGVLGLPVVLARLDGLVSSFLGTTSRNIGTLFTFVSRYRCILLLDEFDAVAKLRDDPHEVGEIKRVVNTLLQNLDSRQKTGLTIAITNHEKLLDSAIWRRFEVQLAIPRPPAMVRLEILRHYLDALSLTDAHYKFLAWLTEGLSGSEIESLGNSVKRTYAIKGVGGIEFLQTIRELAFLNSGRISEKHRQALRLEGQEFARYLANEADMKFDTPTLGVLFDRDKTTIGRWLRPAESARIT